MRPVVVANLVAQIVIVVTGGAVRLTGSGLGCSTWPQCEPGQFTPRVHEATSWHPFIEFGNRTLTGVLVVLAVAVALVVTGDRARSRSYRALGLAPLVGVLAQAVLGGAAVLLDLNPVVVSSHFLVSMALVAVSVVLVRRTAEGDAAPLPAVGAGTRTLSRLLAGVAVGVLALGTVTTGAGPHSGDDARGYRFAVDPVAMARVHALAVWVFVAVLVAVLASLRGAPPAARHAGWVLLVVTLAQAATGYAQLATGLPIALVNLHMLGAALLTAATAQLLLTQRSRGAAPGAAARAARPVPAA